MIKVVAIIPARYGSSRFPGKLLKKIKGKSIINLTHDQVIKSKVVDKVFVATDDQRIFDEVKKFGGNPIMTSSLHKSGSDRIAEALDKIEMDAGYKIPVIANIQGDEPLISPETIDITIKALLEESEEKISVSTPCIEISDYRELFDPNVVKVVMDKSGNAIYFSRLPIPFLRKGVKDLCDFEEKAKENKILLKNYYKHIGLYVFKREFLKIFVNMEPSFLEKMESLEQLRIIESGYKIKLVETVYDSIGIDTEDDFEKVKKILES